MLSFWSIRKKIVNAIRNLVGMPGAADSRDFFDGRIKLVSLWVDRPSLLMQGPLQGCAAGGD